MTWCEVANECNVHTSEVKTTFEELIGLHVAIAQGVRAALNSSKRTSQYLPEGNAFERTCAVI